jgi:uncharacterized protein
VVRLIINALVDDADAVTVSPVESNFGVHFVIMGELDQVGKLIGKNGRTARALRTLVSLIGQRNRASYSIEILPVSPNSN